MHRRICVLTHPKLLLAASAALMFLAGCGGNPSAAAVAETAGASVITQSTITLPSSVQVVSAK